MSGRVGKGLLEQTFANHHRQSRPLSFILGGQDTMLTLVLCNFRASVDKYFLKFNQHHSPRRLHGECFALPLKDVAAPSAIGEVLT